MVASSSRPQLDNWGQKWGWDGPIGEPMASSSRPQRTVDYRPMDDEDHWGLTLTPTLTLTLSPSPLTLTLTLNLNRYP